MTILGITHAKNWSSLFHPVVGTAHGGLMTVPFTAVLALTAVAVFSYNGYPKSLLVRYHGPSPGYSWGLGADRRVDSRKCS